VSCIAVLSTNSDDEENFSRAASFRRHDYAVCRQRVAAISRETCRFRGIVKMSGPQARGSAENPRNINQTLIDGLRHTDTVRLAFLPLEGSEGRCTTAGRESGSTQSRHRLSGKSELLEDIKVSASDCPQRDCNRSDVNPNTRIGPNLHCVGGHPARRGPKTSSWRLPHLRGNARFEITLSAPRPSGLARS
jgi:hypothetical protein